MTDTPRHERTAKVVATTFAPKYRGLLPSDENVADLARYPNSAALAFEGPDDSLVVFLVLPSGSDVRVNKEVVIKNVLRPVQARAKKTGARSVDAIYVISDTLITPAVMVHIETELPDVRVVNYCHLMFCCEVPAHATNPQTRWKIHAGADVPRLLEHVGITSLATLPSMVHELDMLASWLCDPAQSSRVAEIWHVANNAECVRYYHIPPMRRPTD